METRLWTSSVLENFIVASSLCGLNFSGITKPLGVAAGIELQLREKAVGCEKLWQMRTRGTWAMKSVDSHELKSLPWPRNLRKATLSRP